MRRGNVAGTVPPRRLLGYRCGMDDRTLPIDKKALRLAALARRDALDPQWRIEASLAMAETVRRAIAVAPGTVVSGFWPIRS